MLTDGVRLPVEKQSSVVCVCVWGEGGGVAAEKKKGKKSTHFRIKPIYIPRYVRNLKSINERIRRGPRGGDGGVGQGGRARMLVGNMNKRKLLSPPRLVAFDGVVLADKFLYAQYVFILRSSSSSS